MTGKRLEEDTAGLVMSTAKSTENISDCGLSARSPENFEDMVGRLADCSFACELDAYETLVTWLDDHDDLLRTRSRSRRNRSESGSLF